MTIIITNQLTIKILFLKHWKYFYTIQIHNQTC